MRSIHPCLKLSDCQRTTWTTHVLGETQNYSRYIFKNSVSFHTIPGYSQLEALQAALLA
ncbi:predicted protein [Plenodomus lingam JN3]|uniref:Predicted protein n=1 Tax=Leptosphaeria maculans (strain JN3 / isolate v23.1.3 / race Av1-4-5-6-7-8) TaxID=985895 RepID=E5A850_LEPMJ|nr:predicted protein [Plenodomus lingam JN3]CBX99795.1 predicted protein [Plenodomus lingam JN3]